MNKADRRRRFAAAAADDAEPRAEGERRSQGRSHAEITCSEIAQSLARVRCARSARNCQAKDGPLDLIGHENIDRIETNLQIAHAPKSAVRDFRTDYLLKVFRYDRQARVFAEAPMENQIDRARLLADDGLKREFRAWLLDPVNLAAFDRGTVLIPEKFLANGAIAPTPVGFDPSDLEPEFGLVQGEGAVFSEADVVAALRKAAEEWREAAEHPLACRVRAPAQRRDLFRLPPDARHRRLSFPRRRLDGGKAVEYDRRAGVAAFLRRPDPPPRYSRKPARRQAAGLFARICQPSAIARQHRTRRHQYYDGWGAHCYVQGKPAASNDGSFRDWTCAEGLTCQAAGKISRIGMCFVKSR